MDETIRQMRTQIAQVQGILAQASAFQVLFNGLQVFAAQNGIETSVPQGQPKLLCHVLLSRLGFVLAN